VQTWEINHEPTDPPDSGCVVFTIRLLSITDIHADVVPFSDNHPADSYPAHTHVANLDTRTDQHSESHSH
jgi:hypothetical protein